MKNRILGFCLALLLVAGAAGDAYAAGKKNASKKKEAKKTEKVSRYDKLFKDKKVQTSKGMMTLHLVDGKKVYFEMPATLLGREFLLGSKITETSDQGSGLVGFMGNTPEHIRFSLTDSTLRMSLVSGSKRDLFCSDSEEEGVQEGMRINNIEPVVESFKVLAWNADSTAMVFDMTSYLVSHNENIVPMSSGKRTVEYGRAGQSVNFQEKLSYPVSVKAFEDNVSVVSSLTYYVNLTVGGGYVISKDEPLTAKANRVLMLLPEKPVMQPRIADPRIGIGTVERENMTTKVDRSRLLHHMTRWDIQPANAEAYQRGELTEPAKPIVFYLDPNFPASWRQPIIDGVCDWNKAFEAIGLKNVVRVEEYPKDNAAFDPDNMKYNTIRYAPVGLFTMMQDASWADPRSGEIRNASLFLFHDLLQWNNIQRFLLSAQVDPRVRTKKLPDEVMGETIRCAVRREIGKSLGLTSNMAGSSAIPTDSLRSADYTRRHGITASVMDDISFNYVAQPGDQGVVLAPSLGTYDYHAIKIAYKPVFGTATPEEEYKTVCEWIAQKMGDPMYRYAPRQYLLTSFDPSALPYDLGDDALKAGEYGIRNLQYIFNHMDEWMKDEDKDFEYRNTIYRFMVPQLRQYLFAAYRNIGSFYLNEHYVGDPLTTIKAVPKEVQRKSLEWLFTQLKSLEWIDNPAVTAKLSFNGSQARKILLNYVEKEKNVTTDLYQTKRLSLTYHRDPTSYSPEEYIDDLYRLVWTPTMEGRSLTAAERILQAEFLANVRNDVDINGTRRWFGQYFLQDGTLAAGLDDELEEEEEPENSAERAYGRRWVVENIAADNQKHLWFSTYSKILDLVRRQRLTGDEQTRAHYDYLLFLATRSWKDHPKI